MIGSAGVNRSAAEALRRLRAAGLSLAVAESLTGGDVASAFVAVPGASHVFRGGLIAYATDLKTSLLGVPGDVLDTGGPVQATVALEMAHGVRGLMGADVGLGTTGVAGPGPEQGVPAGTAYVAVCSGAHSRVRRVRVGGCRREVRRAVTGVALALLFSLAADLDEVDAS